MYITSNTKNLLQIQHTNLNRFGDRAFCAYAPRLWNELTDNIKAADSVRNFKKQQVGKIILEISNTIKTSYFSKSIMHI